MFNTVEEINTAKQMISPPGDTLAEILSIKGISKPTLALLMNVSFKTINQIIKGKVVITPETAILLEKALEIDAAFWLEREKNYRFELTEINKAKTILKTKD